MFLTKYSPLISYTHNGDGTHEIKFIIIIMNALYIPLSIKLSIINENIVRLPVNEQYDGA